MQPHKKIPVVAVVGPTASGKTSLAIALCQRLGGEVISGDSMQLYRQLSIATAKPTPAEQSAAPHHLIDILEPWESCSVARYTQLAHAAIAQVAGRGQLPVLCGGTGLYIRSLLANITFAEQERDEVYRESLRKLATEQGNEAVYQLLVQADPEAAAAIHPNNLGRVIRALEMFHVTGSTKTTQLAASTSQPTPYQSCILALGFRDRQQLYDRIDHRVDRMVEQGLLQEARVALSMELSPTAAQAIGYKELRPYFEGNQTLEQALDALKQQSRRYAKRQLTWFKREEGVQWLYPEDYSTPEALYQAAVAIVTHTIDQMPLRREGHEE